MAEMYLALWWCLVSVILANAQPVCDNGASGCQCRRYSDEITGLAKIVAKCSGLNLIQFPDITKFTEDVNVLDLNLNNIEILDTPISSESVTRIILSHNRINFVDVNFFKSLPELRLLDLSYNNITSLEGGDIFSTLTNLYYLNLAYNNLKVLPDGIFEPLHALTHLDLSNNPLGPFLMNSKDVLAETLAINSNITHLALNNVEVSDLHPDYFSIFIRLEYLDMADNEFNLIPLVPYSVEHLDLSGNNLTFLSAKYLNYHSLKYLKLSRMPSLTNVHHYAFYNLQSLESLIITDCTNLKNFTELAFGIPSKTLSAFPKYLSLARNGLTSINESYKYLFRKMDHIDLRYNPWKCNCDLLWLQEFDGELLQSSEIRCSSPKVLRHRSVMDLNQLDLQQCYPEIYGKPSHRILIVVLMAVIILLIGFIFYLVKYPKTWLKPNRIGISPYSPYNPAPLEEPNRH
ncbi:chondroadherin-like [Cylas formicarius]|uniref:chondroadherin-like n=1 Tax=Cylas formicarius TaxID=197179 RepID=UPI002958BB29|nr:chondroadherin-like [Cylas formicarius]